MLWLVAKALDQPWVGEAEGGSLDDRSCGWVSVKDEGKQEEPVDMIGGFCLEGAEIGGVKVAVRRCGIKEPDMLTWKQWYVALSWKLVWHPEERPIS